MLYSPAMSDLSTEPSPPTVPDADPVPVLLETAAAPSPGPSPASDPAFSLWGTALSSVLVVAFTGSLLWNSTSLPLDRLEFPEQSLERLVSREMDLRDAVRRAPIWEQRAYTILSGEEDELKDSIEWYEELAGSSHSSLPQLYRVILLAEDGQLNRVNTAIVPWEFRGEDLARMAEWVRVAYLGMPIDAETGRAVESEIREELPANWFADTLIRRVAAQAQDVPLLSKAESAIVGRGESLLNRRRIIVAVEVTLFTVGLGLLVGLGRRLRQVRLGDAQIPPPWTAQDGYALFIRGALGFLVVSAVAPLIWSQTPFVGLSTLAAGLPMLAWAGWYLAARRISSSEAFGLQWPAGGVARLVGVTLLVVGLGLAGEIVISLVGGLLHVKGHWADDLLEDVLWGPAWVAAGVALDSIVWAPFVEEIAFRGILYATLRRKMAGVPSVLVSAVLFAAVHGYSPMGFASVCWSGVLWAVTYERTRSLLPGMLAHAVNNFLVMGEFVWLIRV